MKSLMFGMVSLILAACTGAPRHDAPPGLADRSGWEVPGGANANVVGCKIMIRGECWGPPEGHNIESMVVAMAADLQPWRLASDAGDPNSFSNAAEWLNDVSIPLYHMRGDYGLTPASIAIFNGDMTEFGWHDQRRQAQVTLETLAYDVKPYFGLGNHDIANNNDDCWDGTWPFGSSDACARNMANWLRNSIWAGANEDPTFRHDAPGGESGWSASNAYSFEVTKGLRFIQLNFYPEYTVRLDNNDWTSSLPFLGAELSRAQQDGDLVVLNWHAANAPSAELSDLLKRYRSTIVAIFTGHTHQWGFEENFAGTGIPHWTSNALFNGAYYRLQVHTQHTPQSNRLADLQIDVQQVTALRDFNNGSMNISVSDLNTFAYQGGSSYLCPPGVKEPGTTGGIPSACKAL